METYIPGAAYPSYYYSWGGYYSYVYNPGYVMQDDFAYLETNLYQTASEKLAWSARSETWIAASKPELITTFVTVIVDKLATDKVIN